MRVLRTVIFWGLLLMGLGWSLRTPPAEADTFEIAKIWGNPEAISASALSLNDAGQIAYLGQSLSEGRSDIYLYDGKEAKNITSSLSVSPHSFSSLSLNNQRQIAFFGYDNSTWRSRIYLYDGDRVSNMTGDQNIPPPSSLVLNDKGQIALSVYDSSLLQSDIYLYSAGVVSNLTKDLDIWASSPSMNYSGQIAFVGESQDLGRQDIYLFTDNTFTNITVDLDIKNASSPTINNQGEVAFVGVTKDGRRRDIYLYAANSLTNITANLDIAHASFPHINNQGQIIFIGQDRDYTRSDIYLFADNTLTNLTYSLDISSMYPMSQLNDAGQIAFLADSIVTPIGIPSRNISNKIYFFDGSVIRNITPLDTGTYGYAIITSFSLNNKGQIAFLGYQSAGRALSTAFDPVLTNVLRGIPNPELLGFIPDIFPQSLFSTSLYLYNGYQVETIKQGRFSTYPSYLPSSFLALNDTGQIVFHNGYILYLATRTNSRPIAKAGSRQLVEPCTSAGLDGSASFDPDKDTLSYHWSLVSKPVGSQAVLSDPEKINPSLLADKVGVYEVQLKVHDGKEQGIADSSLIIVREPAELKPLAYAGRDQVVATGSPIKLDGSDSYNPGNDTLTYHWSLITKPPDSLVSIVEPGSKTPSFKPDRDGVYRIALVVENSQGQSLPDIQTILSLGKEQKIQVAIDKPESSTDHTMELLVWAGNAWGEAEVTADCFIGLGVPDGRLFFLTPSLNLISSDPADPRTFTPFAQDITLSPGQVFPSSVEMDTDLDGNGKLDSYRLFSVNLPQGIPPGEYFAFAALAKPGTVQIGTPKLLGPVSIAPFNINP